MSNKLVAVYGTLKRGEGNFSITERCGGRFIGTARTTHSYCMYGGWGFPRVTQDAEVCPIEVEVFELDDFTEMDCLEGHPDFFERKQVQVDFYDKIDDVQLAWMYFHPPVGDGSSNTVVKDGMWGSKRTA